MYSTVFAVFQSLQYLLLMFNLQCPKLVLLFPLLEFPFFFHFLFYLCCLPLHSMISMISRPFSLFFSYLVLFVHLSGWWIRKHRCRLRAIFSFRSQIPNDLSFIFIWFAILLVIQFMLSLDQCPVHPYMQYIIYVQNSIYRLYMCFKDLIRDSEYEYFTGCVEFRALICI